MSEHVLDHHYEGERERLALISALLDPMHRRHIERLGVGDRLGASGKLDEESIETFLVHCGDPGWWTQTIAFAAVSARAAKDGLDA